MTTTIPTQAAAADLRIITTPPTAADAQLILQLMQVDAATGAHQGWQLLRTFEKPPTMSQLRRRYPEGGDESRQINAFLMSCETLGTFVKQGILNEPLVHDLFWVAGAWHYAEKICKAMRKETGEPRLYENFELLASRAT